MKSRIFTDQMGRAVPVPETPKRIISLVPSQTELLVDMGLHEQLVGVTKFCTHPKGLKQNKTIIGGTKNFRMEVIDQLKPDLIIGNKEENYKEGIEALEKKYPVWMSDIKNIPDALQMMRSIGEITGKKDSAMNLADSIGRSLEKRLPCKGTAIYLIWKEPYMLAGSDTFIQIMLEKAGFENLVSKTRYPEATLDELVQMAPKYVLLSSEPYPFSASHLKEFTSYFPKSMVLLVDGELFSWYGSRLRHSMDYFDSLP